MSDHHDTAPEYTSDPLPAPILGVNTAGFDPSTTVAAQSDLETTKSRLMILVSRRERLEKKCADAGPVKRFAAHIALAVTGEQQRFNRRNLLRIYSACPDVILPGVSFSPENEERFDE